MFARIVIAYDDSPGARCALELALGMAAQSGARWPSRRTCRTTRPPSARSMRSGRWRNRPAARWLAAATAAADEHGINLRTEIRAGHPAQELVRAVTAHQADLLVLGRSGHSAIWGRFIGTTAEKAARHVECSVLIANPPTA